MTDEVAPSQESVVEYEHVPETGGGAWKWVAIILAILYAAGSLYFLFAMKTRIDKLASQQDSDNMQLTQLNQRLRAADAATEALAQQLGMTKKELAQRAEQLQRQQKAAVEQLSEEQKRQIGLVSGDIASVKTDVGGVKTDVASTKSELAATEAKLQSTIGDLGVQSGLIAHTRDDLEVLKHKGDRNYYEFTLVKGAKPQPVATVSLQLKKTDVKKGRFTLNVTSDDKTIEKKDRNIAEPIQFYSGKDHLLFELVVWTVEKNKAVGYLSTPKGAPVPVTAGQ